MANHTEQMRLFMALTEADYTGPVDHPEVSYSHNETKGEITKVIANLKGNYSGKFTKLGRTLNRISWLSEKLDQLTAQAKQETREHIAELFHAEDAVRTRVIDTVSFTLTMTKDPTPSKTVKYAKVLEELEEHLTPDLLAIMNALVEKHSSITTKAPALIKRADKAVAEEGIDMDLNEGVWDGIKAFVAKFSAKIMSWTKSYDAKLDKLKAMAQTNESMYEIPEAVVEGSSDGDQLVDRLVTACVSFGSKAAGNPANLSSLQKEVLTLANEVKARIK